MEESFDFAPLLLILMLAFFVPLVLTRIRWIPVVVGEIMAGVLIGQSGLGWVGHHDTVEVMGNIGLAFLMFLAGMEIDFSKLFPARIAGQTRNGPNLPGLALAAYLITLALAIPGGFLLHRLGLQGNPWLLAFILSATSLGVLLPVLKQRGLTHTLAGQVIFLTALLADFVTVILLTVFIITLESGPSLEIFSVGLLFVAFFLVYRLGGHFFRMKRVRAVVEELSQVTVQIKVRFAITILMAFVVLAGFLGVELILGAFLAGMIISLLSTPEDIDPVHKLEAFGYAFFIPVFFILVGVNLDLQSLIQSPQSLLLLPVLFIIALLVKFLPSLVFRRMLTWQETLAGAFLLNTHLSIEIAVAVIGMRLGLITPAANAAIILFAVLTVFFMPILFNALMPFQIGREKSFVLIYGADDLGLQVGRVLHRQGEQVHFLERDQALVEQARRAGFKATVVDTLAASLDPKEVATAQSLIALAASDDRNLQICAGAQQFGLENITALVNDPLRIAEYRHLGVHPFAPALFRPALLAMLARSPALFKLLTETGVGQDIREAFLSNSELQGERLRDLGLPGSLLVLSVGRQGELMIPHGNTRLEVGDRLTLVGDPDGLQEAVDRLECRAQLRSQETGR